MYPEPHPQDELLIIEALIYYQNITDGKREDRAWKLADEIAAKNGLSTREAVKQIDHDWPA